MALVNGGYLHDTDKEVLQNSSLKPPKVKLAMVLSKIQVNNPGHLGPLVFHGH